MHVCVEQSLMVYIVVSANVCASVCVKALCVMYVCLSACVFGYYIRVCYVICVSVFKYVVWECEEIEHPHVYINLIICMNAYSLIFRLSA